MNNSQNCSDALLEKSPLVSVGIPTYNRPDGLRRTLECITGQTYKNLEIIVSDNCSPGPESEVVVQEFMAKDPRIQYYRQETNQGPTFNFQFVLDTATGEYFMWAADDDEWDSTYISKCLNVLVNNPDVVLCSTWASLIGANQTIVRKVYYEDIDTFSTFGRSRIRRLKKVIRGVVQNTHFYGLRRTSATKKIKTKNYFGNDHVWMMQLSYYGSFVIIPEVLYFVNITGNGSSAERILQVMGNKSVLVKISPSFSIMRSYIEEILSTKCLSGREKLFAIVFVIERYITWPYRSEIIGDLMQVPSHLLPKFH